MNTIHIILIVAAIYLAYQPGLFGAFQFDDYPNIIYNERLHVSKINVESITRAALSSSSGILRRPVSMASFSINYYISALNPFSYKVTNLLIHILNSLGVYWLCLLLFKAIPWHKNRFSNETIAFFIALAWGIHPINLTAVLYVIQRMTSLATLFTICGIGFYLHARSAFNNKQIKKACIYLVLVVISGIIGVFSKESAALLFVYLFIIECMLYRYTQQQYDIFKYYLFIFFLIFLIIPLVFVISYSIIAPDWILMGYNSREFNISERVLSELSIIWIYIYWIVLPKNNSFGFFHDDITINELTNSLIPFLSGTGHLVVAGLILYLWKEKKQPLLILGVGLFYASHLMESTVLSLELIFEHRNYFGSFGLLLAIASVMLSINNKHKYLCIITVIIYVVLLGFITIQRSSTWGFGITNALVDVQHHPDSAASHYELGRQYSLLTGTEHIADAIQQFEITTILDRKKANGLFALISLAVRNDMPLEAEHLDTLEYRLQYNSMNASHVTWLGTIVKCYLNSTCSITQEQITAIVQAALHNKTLDQIPLNKSYVYMIASNLLSNAGNNYKQALDFSIIAANSSPLEVKFTINVINLTLSHQDHTTAQQWISKLKHSFSMLYPQEIIALERRLQLLKTKHD